MATQILLWQQCSSSIFVTLLYQCRQAPQLGGQSSNRRFESARCCRSGQIDKEGRSVPFKCSWKPSSFLQQSYAFQLHLLKQCGAETSPGSASRSDLMCELACRSLATPPLSASQSGLLRAGSNVGRYPSACALLGQLV